MKLNILMKIPLEFKCLVLAIMIHICINYLFVFSLPVKKESLRPIFIFWGSFLDPITSNSAQTFSKNPGPNPDPDTLMIPQKVIQPSPFTPQIKPSGFERAIIKEQRTHFPKTTFLDEPPQETFQARPSSVLESTQIPAELWRLRMTAP